MSDKVFYLAFYVIDNLQLLLYAFRKQKETMQIQESF